MLPPRDVPASDKKSRRCCWYNSLATVTIPLGIYLPHFTLNYILHVWCKLYLSATQSLSSEYIWFVLKLSCPVITELQAVTYIWPCLSIQRIVFLRPSQSWPFWTCPVKRHIICVVLYSLNPYMTSQLLLSISHARLNPAVPLALDWSSSFPAFADKPFIIFTGALIMGLLWHE